MNEIELQRLYEVQLTAQTGDERIPVHDRNAAAAVLDASGRLLGARLRPGDEHRFRTKLNTDSGKLNSDSGMLNTDSGEVERPFRSS